MFLAHSCALEKLSVTLAHSHTHCASPLTNVLGAAMFHVRVGDQSVVYTGDYNMTPDRHLGAAWIDKVRDDDPRSLL